MKINRKVYTLRPYYIDYELLYDVYSTVMDGYSDTQEIVEITKDVTKKNKRINGSGEFSVTSILKGAISGELNNTNESEKNLQVKSIKQLPPSVLLNWLLNKMQNDLLTVEATSRWVHRGIAPRGEDIGAPIVLKGCIKPNSSKNLKELNICFEKTDGILGQINTFLNGKQNKKSEKIKKYIFVSKREYGLIERAFQNLRIHFELFEEIVQANKQTLDEKLSIELSNFLFSFRTILYGPYHPSVLVDKLDSLKNNISRGLIYSLDKKISDQLKVLLNDIEQYKQTYETENKKSSNISNYEEQDKYIFDLREQMYYHANSTDILKTSQINCFGLIKNVGEKVYELEVIALYI